MTEMRLVAWFIVMFEKAAMRLTKASAGVSGDACTTEIRLVDCCTVRAAADDMDGSMKNSMAGA